jgi:hypothetical protein
MTNYLNDEPTPVKRKPLCLEDIKPCFDKTFFTPRTNPHLKFWFGDNAEQIGDALEHEHLTQEKVNALAVLEQNSWTRLYA